MQKDHLPHTPTPPPPKTFIFASICNNESLDLKQDFWGSALQAEHCCNLVMLQTVFSPFMAPHLSQKGEHHAGICHRILY